MKLLALADIHGNFRDIPLLAELAQSCDAVVIAGDITNFGGKEQALQVLRAVGRFAKPILAVPGNCDLQVVDDTLTEKGANLNGNAIGVGGIDFVGVGGSLPCPGEAGEMVFSDILNQSVSKCYGSHPLVLVSHQPAWGIELDRAGSGSHAGSRSIRAFIEEYQPVLAVSGHMHEALGTDQLDKTTLVNPGPFRQGCFATIELSSEGVKARLGQL